MTYSEVGEGTNKSLDIDRYDPYFEQLFIWDESEKQIVGGYRVGKGTGDISRFGMKGFYITSLFKIKPEIHPCSQCFHRTGPFIYHQRIPEEAPVAVPALEGHPLSSVEKSQLQVPARAL